MSELFLKVFNISLSAVWIVCGVILVRAVFRRAPKWVCTLLWGLVGLRLLLPALPESSVSLLPAAEAVPASMLTAPEPALHTRLTLMDDALNPILADSLSPAPGDSVNPLQVLTFAGSIVWCAGIVLMLAYAAVSTVRLRLRMKTAVETERGVYRTDAAPTPFILGVFRPLIYIPFNVPEDALPYVLAHERAHLARHDHRIKPFAFLLLAVHWFNPFLWLAFVLLSRDIEAACDERVIQALTPEERAGYSEALLNCSVSRRRMVSACPLAFGEVGVKERVKSVLSYKKPAFWVLILSLAAAAVLALCFLTAPKETRNPAVGEYIPGVSVGNVDKVAYEELSPDFAIGADRNGYAVFVHPDRAFSSFRTLYADELGLIRDRRGLPAFSKRSWRSYKKAGIEETGETDAYTQYFRSYADERAAKEKVLDQYRNLGVIKGVRNYLNMRSGPSTGHEVTGIIFKNCGVDILEEKDGWLKISSGGAEGFVKKEYVATGDEARQIALDHMSFQAVVIPDTVDVFNENGEFLTKILKGEKYNVLGFSGNLVDVQAVEGLDGYVNNGEVRCGFFLDEAIVFSLEGVSQKRQDIINYALQFYGGKYVWGGHNLETGVDCSGYIYCVYTEKFGIDMIEAYSITQSTVGTTVTEETIKPGDLIFYVGRFQGQIGHVAIYIGNGKILHAANESKGICVSSWKYVPPVIMKNVIGD